MGTADTTPEPFAENPSVVVELGGEIDLANASAIRDDLIRAFHRGDGSLIVDLSEVTFIDSSGLSMMVRVQNYIADWRCSVSWRGAREGPKRVFEIAGLDVFLNLVD